MYKNFDFLIELPSNKCLFKHMCREYNESSRTNYIKRQVWFDVFYFDATVTLS